MRKAHPAPPEPELAPSPAGHDPRRRRPWGSGVFELPGRPWSPANGQYTIDRDGYPVLTTDGRPVGHLEDGRKPRARPRGLSHPRPDRGPRGIGSPVLSAGVEGPARRCAGRVGRDGARPNGTDPPEGTLRPHGARR